MKNEEKPLKDLIDKVLRSYGLGDQLDENKIIEVYEMVVGKMIVKHTQKIDFKKGKLYVSINSSVVRNELLMVKTDIKDRINNHFSKNLVEEIILR
jgi:DNA-binding protein Fis